MQQPPPVENNIIEIQRRRKCVEDKDAERLQSNTAISEKCTTQFVCIEQPHQRSVLFSISHVEVPPISCDIDDPAIKVYGLFADDDAAREYASIIKTQDSLFLHPAQKWGVMAHSIKRMLHAESRDAHINALLLRNQQRMQEHKQSFEADRLVEVDHKSQSNGSADHPARAPDTSAFKHKDKLRKLKKTSGVSTIQPLPGQRYLVVSFLPDTISPEIPEPLFCVYAAFDMEEEAKSWIEQNLLSLVQDVDIDIVMACQWLQPQHVTSKHVQNEKFRDDELDRVMQHKRQEPGKVKTYTQWLEESGGVVDK
eukprot:6196375-Pleurochrysis_carterae.AAC.1